MPQQQDKLLSTMTAKNESSPPSASPISKECTSSSSTNTSSPTSQSHKTQVLRIPVDQSTSKQVVPSQSNDDDDSHSSAYHLKWVDWNCSKIPIVMQSINGPCPLIAIINVLSLREKLKLPTMMQQITTSQLLEYIGEYLMDSVPDEIKDDETALLNFEQNVHDAIEILPKLSTGLDVNIKFTGIDDFEYTPECIIFDLLRISLFHGWLVDPSIPELTLAIGNRSYNQLVDFIITNKNSVDDAIARVVLLTEDFLESSASQLTFYGLEKLREQIKDNEIGILFRNNHFLTILKREGQICQLVTDHGFSTENIVWETLDKIDGDGTFLNSNFEFAETASDQVALSKEIDDRQRQLENDFLMALSLKQEEDELGYYPTAP